MMNMVARDISNISENKRQTNYGKKMRYRINEELTRADVRSIVNSELTDLLKEKDFEKRVRELTTDAMEKFFRMMYNKRGFWKGELRNV